VRELRPSCTIEVLTPDFKGDEAAIATVSEARPDIYAHNLETVERLHPWARPGGRYWRSISFLGYAKRLDPDMLTKSGLMLGMGETQEEIRQALEDLRKAAVDIVTVGQYLRPSEHHAPVARWVKPAEFAMWKRVGEQELGFRHVESGALVRSSYHAEKQARTVKAGGPGQIQDVLEADIPAPAELPGPNGGLQLVQLERRAAS
jgi:lipoic acid synthetase